MAEKRCMGTVCPVQSITLTRMADKKNPLWDLVRARARAILGVDEPEQQQIAALVGQSKGAVNNWSKGVPPKQIDTIEEVATRLGVPPLEVYQAARETLGLED